MTNPELAPDMPEEKWNDDISAAPYGKVLEVKNEQMESFVLATRGYCRDDGSVHEDQGFFTSVFTPDKFFPMPAGRLVIPTKWRLKP